MSFTLFCRNRPSHGQASTGLAWRAAHRSFCRPVSGWEPAGICRRHGNFFEKRDRYCTQRSSIQCAVARERRRGHGTGSDTGGTCSWSDKDCALGCWLHAARRTAVREVEHRSYQGADRANVIFTCGTQLPTNPLGLGILILPNLQLAHTRPRPSLQSVICYSIRETSVVDK